jgi:hypothetical protein
MSTRGKKIGKLTVKLDRKKSRYQWVEVEVELRFDIKDGTFWSQYEGVWYHAETKAALSEQIKDVATKALSIEWKRYIQISYEARSWPIEDVKSRRPACNGQFKELDLHDRSKAPKLSKFDRDDAEYVVCGLELHWSICEISEPYPLPEDSKKMVRAKREVGVWHYGTEKGQEHIGEPREWDDAELPAGTLLWTPDREAVLAEVVAALGKLDARLVELFAGDAETLAARIDGATTDPGRLLTSPAETSKTKRKRS